MSALDQSLASFLGSPDSTFESGEPRNEANRSLVEGPGHETSCEDLY